MEEKNKKLTEQIETFQADFVTRNEFGKEKSNFERKIKSTIEKNIKVQKELDAERNCIELYNGLVSDQSAKEVSLTQFLYLSKGDE